MSVEVRSAVRPPGRTALSYRGARAIKRETVIVPSGETFRAVEKLPISLLRLPEKTVADLRGRPDRAGRPEARRRDPARSVVHSRWDCTLESIPGTDRHAVRLGMRLVSGQLSFDATIYVGPYPALATETLAFERASACRRAETRKSCATRFPDDVVRQAPKP